MKTPNSDESDDSIQRVLQAAGRRLQPADELVSNVRASVHAEWSGVVVGRRRKQRRLVAFGAAAGVAAIAFTAWIGRTALHAPVVTVAKIERITGDVRVSQNWGRPHPVKEHQSLQSGETLITGVDGRVALTLSSGVSVRIDRDTR